MKKPVFAIAGTRIDMNKAKIRTRLNKDIEEYLRKGGVIRKYDSAGNLLNLFWRKQ